MGGKQIMLEGASDKVDPPELMRRLLQHILKQTSCLTNNFKIKNVRIIFHLVIKHSECVSKMDLMTKLKNSSQIHFFYAKTT